jgi:hypothetical protein
MSKRFGCVLALFVTFALVAGPAAAGPLAPRKASELVSLEASPTTTSCAAGNGRAFDLQFRPDGSTLFTYSIPTGGVLVVTDITYQKTGLAAGATYSPSVVTDSLFSIPLVLPTVTANSAGDAGGSVSLKYGPVVRSGTSICFLDNANFTARLYGFVAKDK